MIKFYPKTSALKKFRKNLEKSLKIEDGNIKKILLWRNKLKKKTAELSLCCLVICLSTAASTSDVQLLEVHRR